MSLIEFWIFFGLTYLIGMAICWILRDELTKRYAAINNFVMLIPVLNQLWMLFLLGVVLLIIVFYIINLIRNLPTSLMEHMRKSYADLLKAFAKEEEHLTLHERRKKKIQAVTKKWYQW